MAQVMVATGAGSDARVLHVAAMRRAQALEADLIAVHVIGGGDYSSQPEALRHAIRAEMEWLIHTMMGLAESRVGASVGTVTVQVREGDVAAELIEFAKATRPEVLMLGVPRAGDRSEFPDEAFAALIADLEGASIRVEQVPTG